MTQSDLFGNEPHQCGLNLWIEEQLVTDGEPVTMLEMSTWARGKDRVMLGRLRYTGMAHELLPGDVEDLVVKWCWASQPDIRKYLKKRQRDLDRYQRDHPWSRVPSEF